MIKTIKITGKQQAWLETFQEHQNLLVNCCTNQIEDVETAELTFRFSARPKTVSYEDTQLELINNEIEHFKKVLTPSMHGKLKALFNDDFMYTPRTRRTAAVATPEVATPNLSSVIFSEESILEEEVLVVANGSHSQEIQVNLESNDHQEEELLNESEEEVVSKELQDQFEQVSSIRGNKYRNEIQHVTIAEFKDLSFVDMHYRVSGMKEWPDPNTLGYLLVDKNGVPYEVQTVAGATEQDIASLRAASNQAKPVEEKVTSKNVVVEAPVQDHEEQFVDTFEGPISVKLLINFDPTRDRISSQMVYEEEKDGVVVNLLKGYRRSSVQGLSTEMTFYINDDNYKAWLKVRDEIYAKRKADAGLW